MTVVFNDGGLVSGKVLALIMCFSEGEVACSRNASVLVAVLKCHSFTAYREYFFFFELDVFSERVCFVSQVGSKSVKFRFYTAVTLSCGIERIYK